MPVVEAKPRGKYVKTIVYSFSFLDCRLVKPEVTEVRPGMKIKDPEFEAVVTGLAIPLCPGGYKYPPCTFRIAGPGEYNLKIRVNKQEILLAKLEQPRYIDFKFSSNDCCIYRGRLKFYTTIEIPDLKLSPGKYEGSIILEPVKIRLTCG